MRSLSSRYCNDFHPLSLSLFDFGHAVEPLEFSPELKQIFSTVEPLEFLPEFKQGFTFIVESMKSALDGISTSRVAPPLGVVFNACRDHLDQRDDAIWPNINFKL